METTTRTPQELIAECCEVNSSWAQGISELGIIASLDWDLCLENSLFADYVAEEMGVSEEEAVAELTRFINATRLVEPDYWVSHMNDMLRVCLENGSIDETVEGMDNYSAHHKRPDVMEALKEAAVGHDDEEEILQAIEALV